MLSLVYKFLMKYNLKLKRRRQKKAVIQESITLEDLPSDDEWITEREEPVLPSSETWLNVIDRAARRYAREASSHTENENIDEDMNEDQYNEVEYLEISDDEVGATIVGSNETSHVHDAGDHEFDADDEDENIETGTGISVNGPGNEDVQDGSFGYVD
ncbi:uncharacterized protein LOC141592824 [Silene latifolia]|uniref:uncharacterized protein LOC141592824 n=1 Tax=Silene latifolia TaxID=37657 RepID=UPI003D774CA5